MAILSICLWKKDLFLFPTLMNLIISPQRYVVHNANKVQTKVYLGQTWWAKEVQSNISWSSPVVH